MTEEYISQDFDFLGSLRERLYGLSGFQTLALELIQNSDDAKAESMVFRFTSDSLIVENSSSFRDVDFERMRKIGSGGKREEEGTIGTFGIGFVSVYQITDHPELISSGKHWIFAPDEITDRRIKSKSTTEKSEGTKFIFPWAFENTKIRNKLEQPTIKKEDLTKYKKELIEIIPKSLIFLKTLSKIELYDEKKLIFKSSRTGNRDDCALEIFVNDKKELSWLMLRSSFEKNILEEKKLNDVYIAIPKNISTFRGLLYIYLPSQMETNFPFHIQADFYPTPDRKSIVLDGDDKAEWNRRAINSIANLLASNVIEIRDNIGPDLLFKCFRACRDYSNDSVFNEFWEILKPVLSNSEIVLTSTNKWIIPNETFLLGRSKEDKYLQTLQRLDLEFVNPKLRGYKSILNDIGVEEFLADNLIEAIKQFNLEPGKKLSSNKSPFNSREYLIDIYKEFNELLEQENDDDTIEEIESLVIGLSLNGKLYRINEIKRLNKDEKETFHFLKDKLLVADELELSSNIVNNLIPRLDIEDIITELSKLSKEDYLELYTNEKANFISIYEYCADNKKQIIKNRDLFVRFKKIPMFLAHDEFKPLEDLSLPGSFKDPLKLDILIQGKLNGKITDFLKEIGVEELDLLTYCKNHLPKILTDREITIEENRVLIDELVANFSKIKDHKDIIKKLGNCNIVECEDGLVRAANEVYFDNDILETIFKNKEFHTVAYPPALIDSSKDFYKSIGVTETPRAKDIIKCINKIISKSPDETNIKTIENFFNFINDKWDIYKDRKDEFDLLKTLNWLPCEGNQNKWFKPSEVFSNSDKNLFYTQARFIPFTKYIFKEFSDYLGLRSEPTTQQVINHLLHCSENSIGVNERVYNHLNQKYEEAEINQLLNTKCINIKSVEYLNPNQVYWFDNPFPSYRYNLNPSLRIYNNLFTKIGVKDKPDTIDFINVILEISDKYGSQNLEVDSISLDILSNSYNQLQQCLYNGNLDLKQLDRLKNKKVIPQNERLLYRPDHLFFEDKPNISKKFGARINTNLINRDLSNYLIFENLGVRYLSNGIIKSDSIKGKNYNSEFTLFLKSFKQNFLRIIENRKKSYQTGWNEKILDNAEIFDVNELTVKYVLQFTDSHPIKSDNISESVYYNNGDNNFYIKKGEKIKSRQFAKEFALALNSELDTSDLSPLIYEILNSKSSKEAEIILDEYDIDKIVKSEIEDVETGEVIDSLGNQSDDVVETVFETEGEKKEENFDDIYEFDPTQIQSLNNNNFKLRSYVIPPNSDDTVAKKDPNISQEEINRIDKSGIEKVLSYEVENGRDPTEMSHTNEGYDIKSMNANGELERFIEVKSTRKKWEGFEVELSDSQFFLAKELGDKFYLYVVDQVLSENCKIYEIQDPANKATGFLFDSPWKDS